MAREMNRRGLLTGLASLIVAAPAIVRAGSLMPVRSFTPPYNIGPIIYIDDDFIFDGAKWTVRCEIDEVYYDNLAAVMGWVKNDS